MYNNTYVRNQNPLGRRIRGCVTGLILLALVVGGLIFVLSRIHGGVAVSVGDHPSIIGKECTGDIRVYVGQPDQVVLSGLFPQYQQDATGNILDLTPCDDGQITMTVPPHTNLEFDEANTVTIFGVSGTINLDVNGGPVTMIGCTLEGQSKIGDNGGVVTFDGTLAQGSTSTIDDNGGTVETLLPSVAAFHLDVSGIPGPIASDYSQVQSTPDSTTDIKTDIGSAAPTATLNLSLNDTGVVLRKGP